MKILLIVLTAVCLLTIYPEQPDLTAAKVDSTQPASVPAAPDSSRFHNGRYVPADLEECFVQLDTVLSVEDIETIKALADEQETIRYHHGLGLWLRNNWGLWAGSRLSIWFLHRGIAHPDDMSAYILEQYWRYLNGEEIVYPRKTD